MISGSRSFPWRQSVTRSHEQDRRRANERALRSGAPPTADLSPDATASHLRNPMRPSQLSHPTEARRRGIRTPRRVPERRSGTGNATSARTVQGRDERKKGAPQPGCGSIPEAESGRVRAVCLGFRSPSRNQPPDGSPHIDGWKRKGKKEKTKTTAVRARIQHRAEILNPIRPSGRGASHRLALDPDNAAATNPPQTGEKPWTRTA